jgi:hypothetical protein
MNQTLRHQGLVYDDIDTRLELSYEALANETIDATRSQLVLDAFEKCCGHLPIDATLAKAIIQYETRFVTKNADHIAFFGGHLLGVNPVKFLPSDQNTWNSRS